MKKMFKIVVLILICSITYNVSAAIHHKYTVKVINQSGAVYYERDIDAAGNIVDIEKGVLQYGENIYIEDDGTNVIHTKMGLEMYAPIKIDDKTYYINYKDLQAVNDYNGIDSIELIEEKLVFSNQGAQLYDGPGFAYDKKNIVIPEGSKINTLRAFHNEWYERPVWYYVHYDGVNGWVNAIAANMCSELDAEKFFLGNDLEVKFNGKKYVFPANTKFDYVCSNSNSYLYVKYNDITIEVSPYALYQYEENPKVIYAMDIISKSDRKLYKQASIDSDILSQNINDHDNITVLAVELGQSDYDWLYVEYNGIRGYIKGSGCDLHETVCNAKEDISYNVITRQVDNSDEKNIAKIIVPVISISLILIIIGIIIKKASKRG